MTMTGPVRKNGDPELRRQRPWKAVLMKRLPDTSSKSNNSSACYCAVSTAFTGTNGRTGA